MDIQLPPEIWDYIINIFTKIYKRNYYSNICLGCDYDLRKFRLINKFFAKIILNHMVINSNRYCSFPLKKTPEITSIINNSPYKPPHIIIHTYKICELTCTHIISLHVSNFNRFNHILNKHDELLAKFVSNNKNLKKLYLQGIINLSKTFKALQNSNIVNLIITDNILFYDEISFVDMLEHNRSIQYLEVDISCINNEAARLEKILIENKTIKTIYLRLYNISNEKIHQCVNNVIKYNTTITNLTLYSGYGLDYFCNSLKNNKYITNLNIGINSVGYKYLPNIIRENKIIKYLYLNSSLGIPNDDKELIKDALKINKTLKSHNIKI